jgi:hypothetical protein
MATSLYGQLRHKAFLLSDAAKIQGNDIRLAGNVTTDFPATGGKVMPAGAVVVRETTGGLYFLANDATADHGERNTAAVVTSLEKPDADWKDKTLTWTLSLPDGTTETGTVVASGADDDTIAEWVTLCNADIAFGSRMVASDSGAGDLLVVTTLMKGRVHLLLSMDLDTAYASDDGSTSSDEDEGTEADYRVLLDQQSTIDLNGASRTSDQAASLLAGHFDESELYGITAEAKAVLMGRGSIFA